MPIRPRRGTVSDVLSVIEVLYQNRELQPQHEYPIGGFFKYLINFEPQDQGISLKAFEKKIVSFKTVDDKYLSHRGGRVSIQKLCKQGEQFRTEVHGDRIAFRTEGGLYLSAGDGQVLLKETAGSTEKFHD